MPAALPSPQILFSGYSAHKIQEAVGIFVRRVAGNARHARPNGDVLPHNSDALSAVLQDSPQTPGRLVAHEEECALFVRQVALLMVENAAAVAHTGTGDDN